MENPNEYKSVDLNISAVILACRVPLKRLEKVDYKTFSFVFDTTEQKANELISKHWARILAIPTRDLTEAITELKTRIHSGI